MENVIKIIMNSGIEYMVPVSNYLKDNETVSSTEMLIKVLGDNCNLGTFSEIVDVDGKYVSIKVTSISSIEWPIKK